MLIVCPVMVKRSTVREESMYVYSCSCSFLFIRREKKRESGNERVRLVGYKANLKIFPSPRRVPLRTVTGIGQGPGCKYIRIKYKST